MPLESSAREGSDMVRSRIRLPITVFVWEYDFVVLGQILSQGFILDDTNWFFGRGYGSSESYKPLTNTGRCELTVDPV